MIKKQKYIVDFVTSICVPVIEMNLTSVQVQGGERRLRATWTPELVQDIEAYHNIDAEAELTAMLTEQITQEIDNQIIQDLRNMVPIEEPYIDPLQPKQSILTVVEVNKHNSEIERMKRIKDETVSKWDSLGFLDGLEGHVRGNIATLMEGQAATLINETPEPENDFDTVVFPIVRRVFAQTVGLDIVPLQPLDPPLADLVYFTPQIQHNTFHHNLGGQLDLPYGVEENLIWRTEDTWEYEGLYGSLIGGRMEMKPLYFTPKKNLSSLFDSVTLPTVDRVFV